MTSTRNPRHGEARSGPAASPPSFAPLSSLAWFASFVARISFHSSGAKAAAETVRGGGAADFDPQPLRAAHATATISLVLTGAEHGARRGRGHGISRTEG